MRHLILLSMLLVVLPAIFQAWYGRKAIDGTTCIHLGWVCLVSIVAQAVFTGLGFLLTLKSLSAIGIKCGVPAVGIFAVSFLFSLMLLVIMGVQLCLKFVRKGESL